ncbi:hypothetical protein [Corynebacterium auriscanis]|uniref:hypothetical protein n=1 Tax=Corynebacterium auriscanis TaxID=99807 RepID=UPI00224724AA|nr:hypothetical protein [Corynebacterium auriscanis]MCX2163334.1 hypothetical protein [Corynebacterium auriscanis]
MEIRLVVPDLVHASTAKQWQAAARRTSQVADRVLAMDPDALARLRQVDGAVDFFFSTPTSTIYMQRIPGTLVGSDDAVVRARAIRDALGSYLSRFVPPQGRSERGATLGQTEPGTPQGRSERSATLGQTEPGTPPGRSERGATLSQTEPGTPQGRSERSATLGQTEPGTPGQDLPQELALGADCSLLWRGALPPATGYTLIDTPPGSVLRELYQAMVAENREHSGPAGIARSLLDQELMEVSSDSAQVSITGRMMATMGALGLAPEPVNPAMKSYDYARVSAHASWIRVDGVGGTLYAPRPGGLARVP